MTSQNTVDVEVLTGSGCGYCQKAMALVRVMAAALYLLNEYYFWI